jgi:hypothetical protein
MVEMALLFVAASILVLLGLLAASIVYVPKALATEHDDDDDHGGHAA